MQTKQFNKLVVAIVLILIILAAVMSFFVYKQGPRVRLARPDDAVLDSAYTRGSSVKIFFDRPIKKTDYTDSVRINPDVENTVVTNDQSLTVTFNESLNHNTEYVLSISPDIADRVGIRMKGRFNYSFKTAQPSFMYLQRNYGQGNEGNDNIVQRQIGSNSEKIIYSAPVIRSFAANYRYVAAVVAEESIDRLEIIDLKNKKVLKPQLYLKGVISNIVITPRGSTILFTTRQSISQGVSENFLNKLNVLKSYDIETDNFEIFKTAEGDELKTDELIMSNDGQAALVKNDKSTYFAISPYNDYDPAPLGTHFGAFGFNDTSSEIIFRDRSGISVYDIDEGKLNKKKVRNFLGLQTMDNSYGKIFSLYNNFDAGRYSSYIYSQANWSDGQSIEWALEDTIKLTADDFSQTYDNKLLAIKLKNVDCEFDDLEINSNCKNIKTRIVEAGYGGFIEDIDGFDLVWLP